MFKLIKADFYRIMHKRTFYVYTLFCTVVYGLIILGMKPQNISSDDYVTYANMIIMLSTLVIGIFLYSVLYGDDLKNKNSQAILGFGYNRKDIVLRKFLVFIVLVILAFLYLYLVINIYAIIFNFSISSEMHKILLVNIAKKISMILVYASITNMLAFGSQSATSSIVLFVLLVTGTIGTILNLILSAGPVVRLIGDLTPYLVSSLHDTVGNELMSKGLIFSKEMVYLLIYIGVATAASILLFEHKELEF